MDNILASGISNRDHLAAFDNMAAARMSALEVEKVLIYLIDTVDVDALQPLAEQFDLLGYRGWKLAKTEADKRALIKRAIELHRYKGTPYSIKESLKSVGFFNTVIQERIGNLYDGVATYNGLVNHGAGNWATFRVIFDLGGDKGINSQQTADLLGLVDEYKNVRSVLMGFSWKATIEEVVEITDELEVTVVYGEMTDVSGIGVNYNATASYNGAESHNRIEDVLEVTELSADGT